MKLLKRLFSKKPEYIYGFAGQSMKPARKHKSGRVEFVMWKAGEQGHSEDYWMPLHEYWWPTFSVRALESHKQE